MSGRPYTPEEVAERWGVRQGCAARRFARRRTGRRSAICPGVALTMKHCSACGTDKPLDDFYRTAKGGAMHICKNCHKARMKERRLSSPYVQEYDRQRAKLPHRRANSRRVSVRWREQHPDAYKAQTAVGNALRDGNIKRLPCALCGSTKHVHGHHKDYSKPLAVTWLCAKCHHRLHATFPELGGHNEARP